MAAGNVPGQVCVVGAADRRFVVEQPVLEQVDQRGGARRVLAALQVVAGRLDELGAGSC